MDELEWQDTLKPMKEKMQHMDVKTRRRTMDQFSSFLKGDDDDSSGHALPVRPRKLRPFSGSSETRAGEVDFRTWKLYASTLVDDLELRESEKKRVILESLLSPALEVACTLESHCSANDVVHILEQHYGDVADGYELYSQFRACIQGVHEPASDYLHRLHLLALKAAEKRGMVASQLRSEVLRQFESNCADEDLLMRVGVRSMFGNPPAVADLLLLIRTEEGRRREKKFRLKARNARANVISACQGDMASEIETLQRQVQTLSLQIRGQASESAAVGATGGTPPMGSIPQGRGRGQRGRGGYGRGHSAGGRGGRRPIFCYHCGGDNHRQSECSSPRNAELVQQKLLARAQQFSSQAAGN